MSPEIIQILTWVFRGLMGIGALASTWFVFDYFRTADLSSPYSRMLLFLNGAIALILGVSLTRTFLGIGQWSFVVTLGGFVVVDIMLIKQIVLLRKARKQFD